MRDRNTLLLSAGFAPKFDERPLNHPALKSARQAIELILKGHEPFPALVIDKYWNIVSSNAPLRAFLELVSDQALLTPPVNVLRLTLSLGGLAPHIVNFKEWRAHLLDRLRRHVELTADLKLIALEKELTKYPSLGLDDHRQQQTNYSNVLVPLKLATPAGTLSLFSTVTVFGTPTEITLSELALEAFYPADDATGLLLRAMTNSLSSRS